MLSELDTIDQLTREATPAAATRLQELERETHDREVRKAARKALYRLSQTGIVPLKNRTPQLAALTRADTLRAFASAFDGAGNRLLLFLVMDTDGGSATLLQILTNDMEGTGNCEAIKIRRRDVDDRVTRIKQQVDTGLAIAEIEPDYARSLLAQSRALTASLSKRTPNAVLVWLPKIGEPGGEYSSPIYNHLTAEAVKQDSGIPSDPASLFKLKWFEPWFFAAEDAVQWLPRWEEITSGDAENVDTGPGTPIYELSSEAANGLMTDAMRALYVRRLEETADVLWRCGKEAEAAQAVYHAIALRETAEPADVPFAHEIAFRTLGAAFEMVRQHRERHARG